MRACLRAGGSRPGCGTTGPRAGRAGWCCSSTSAARWTPTPTRCCASRTRRPGAARPTEVFVLGTRLSRVTREMAHRDPDVAMGLVDAACPDAGGGTRLGVLLKEFLDRWGQRGTARGAVVVVLSDGWERDDPALLGEQVARLSRLAHRVVWSNPRKAAPGFAPVAGGHGRGAAARRRLRRGAQPGGLRAPRRGRARAHRGTSIEEAPVRDVARGAAAWLDAGQRFGLATVVGVSGSSPRPPGRGDGGRPRRRGRRQRLAAAASRARCTSWPGRCSPTTPRSSRRTASATRPRSPSG